MSPRRAPGAEAGFTLVEMMTVMMLAGVLTAGIVAFYLSAQATWTDASTQALAQRDATGIVEALADRARSSATANVAPISGGPNSIVTFFPQGSPNETMHFYWDATDSLVHFGDAAQYDRGPVASSIVERFSLSFDSVLGLVSLDSLSVRGRGPTRVSVSCTFGLYNQPVTTP